jgi:hypothetical protein
MLSEGYAGPGEGISKGHMVILRLVDTRRDQYSLYLEPSCIYYEPLIFTDSLISLFPFPPSFFTYCTFHMLVFIAFFFWQARESIWLPFIERELGANENSILV